MFVSKRKENETRGYTDFVCAESSKTAMVPLVSPGRPMQLKSLAGINFVTRIVGETRSKIVAIRKTVWRLAVRGMVTVVPR